MANWELAKSLPLNSRFEIAFKSEKNYNIILIMYHNIFNKLYQKSYYVEGSDLRKNHEISPKIVKFLNIHSIRYHLKVLKFGLWPCGLIQKTLKIWHFLSNICNICGFWSGHSVLLLLHLVPSSKAAEQHTQTLRACLSKQTPI